MSDTQQGPGWWKASDGRWYPPETHPDYRPPPPPPPRPVPAPPQHARPPAQPRPGPAPNYGPWSDPPQKRVKVKGGTSIWKVALGVMLGMFLFVIACSAIISNGVDTGKKLNPTGANGESDTSPSSSSGASSKTYKVRDKVQTRDGNTVQVYAFVPNVTSSNQFTRPKAGTTYSAIDVEGCAGTKPDSFGLNPFDFSLAMSDNTRAQPTLPVKTPALNSESQAAGVCNRGWVTFEVPDGSTPATVVYGSFGTSVRWVI